MPKSTTPTEAPEAGASVNGPALEGNAFRYEVKLLALADTMPIQFEGITYDLASLTREQYDYLKQFPQQVPYL